MCSPMLCGMEKFGNVCSSFRGSISAIDFCVCLLATLGSSSYFVRSDIFDVHILFRRFR